MICVRACKLGKRWGATVGSVALVAAACGGGGPGDDGVPTPPQPGGQQQGTEVTATETDFAIELSEQTFTPGTYTFVAKNDGQVPHALLINGPGVANEQTETFTSGQSDEISVTLQAGDYEVYCPVGNHRDLVWT